jgi:hypothetical protein
MPGMGVGGKKSSSGAAVAKKSEELDLSALESIEFPSEIELLEQMNGNSQTTVSTLSKKRPYEVSFVCS